MTTVLSRFHVEHLTEAATNDGVRFLSLLGCRVVSGGADCPDRFVRDAQAGQGIRRQAGQSLAELPIEHRFGLVGVTLVQSFADAEDHVEAGGQGNPHLLVDEGIGFAQHVPALAVSEDNVLAADIEEHRRADLAGERAFLFGIEVLRPERDAAALENLPDKSQIGEGRTDGDGDAVLAPHAIHDRPGQPPGLGGGGMHLPVPDDEFLAHVRVHWANCR